MTLKDHEWKALAKEINEVNRANGFDDSTWENIPVKAMMTVTEVDEAWSGVMLEDGEGNLGEELADIAIRILSMLEGIWGEGWTSRGLMPWHLPRQWSTSLEHLLCKIVHQLSGAVEKWRHEERGDARTHLELALREVRCAADYYRINLPCEIRVKLNKNRGRGKWHGKQKGAA